MCRHLLLPTSALVMGGKHLEVVDVAVGKLFVSAAAAQSEVEQWKSLPLKVLSHLSGD